MLLTRAQNEVGESLSQSFDDVDEAACSRCDHACELHFPPQEDDEVRPSDHMVRKPRMVD